MHIYSVTTVSRKVLFFLQISFPYMSPGALTCRPGDRTDLRFSPCSVHQEKAVMARMVAHDYGRQWLAERDAWHEQHATSDDSLRTRMLERCQNTEIR